MTKISNQEQPPERIWIIPDQFWQFWYTTDMKGSSVEYVRATPTAERVEELEAALREVLSGFPAREMLDELDDDQKSGIRPWPMKTPTMAVVRRWHELLDPAKGTKE